jgi:hypothetical protein
MAAERLERAKPILACAAGVGLLMGACWAILLGGCSPTSGDYVKNISAAKPEVATEAMSKAAKKKSRRAIVPLVKRLYDEDPVIRLSAIRTLRGITGQDMDYRYYEPEVKRIAAIKRWEAWLEEQELVGPREKPSAQARQPD